MGIQDTKALNRLTKYGFQQPFCMLYPHLCIQARIPFILTYSSPKEKGFEGLFCESSAKFYIKILELDIAFFIFTISRIQCCRHKSVFCGFHPCSPCCFVSRQNVCMDRVPWIVVVTSTESSLTTHSSGEGISIGGIAPHDHQDYLS